MFLSNVVVDEVFIFVLKVIGSFIHRKAKDLFKWPVLLTQNINNSYIKMK